MVAGLCVALVVQMLWISSLQQHAAQSSMFNQFRTELAKGTAPLGASAGHGAIIAPGTPIAQLSIPAIDLNQTVAEGTSSGVLADGPGHLRSSVFPGGPGTSVILGKVLTYGAPFAHLADLHRGDRIVVHTQVGASTFRVVDLRHAGTRFRPASPTISRLSLATAADPLAPSGVLWVDADRVGKPLTAQAVPTGNLPANEQPLATDTSTLWALFFWLEVFGALMVAAVWTWRHRGHVQAWVVFTAPLVLSWLFVGDQISRLLPNLL